MDLSDAQWAILKPLLQSQGRTRGSGPALARCAGGAERACCGYYAPVLRGMICPRDTLPIKRVIVGFSSGDARARSPGC